MVIVSRAPQVEKLRRSDISTYHRGPSNTVGVKGAEPLLHAAPVELTSLSSRKARDEQVTKTIKIRPFCSNVNGFSGWIYPRKTIIGNLDA